MDATPKGDVMTPRGVSKLLAQAMQLRSRPILIAGAPGIGKSDVVVNAARAAENEVLIMHPVVSNPVDFKGLPAVVNGGAEFLPYGGLRRMIEADRPTVVFLDDIGQSPEAVQAAMMQLLLAREINGQKISDHVAFVAATNRREDRAGVRGMIEPLKSRFIIVAMEADPSEWIEDYAQPHKVDPTLVAFVRLRPALLSAPRPSGDMTNSPSPRGWAEVSRWLKAGVDAELLSEVAAGCVGESAANEFLQFRDLVTQMPDPRKVWADPANAPVPSDPSVLYALIGALGDMAAKAGPTNAAPIVIAFTHRLAGARQEEMAVLFFQDCARLVSGLDQQPAVIAEMASSGIIGRLLD